MGINSRQLRGKASEGRPSHNASLLALLALLPYFLLPLIFYGHLTNSAFPAPPGIPRTGPPIIESQNKEPVPFHDNNSCPICRAASDFQDYGLHLAFQAPDSAFVWLLSDRDGTVVFSKADFVTAPTRAPPVMPLPPTTV